MKITSKVSTVFPQRVPVDFYLLIFSFKEADADWIGNEVINSVGADGDGRGEWGAEMPL